MRRTKEWWGALSPEERAHLVYLERADNMCSYHDGYIPDDCSYCSACGEPQRTSGLCDECSDRLEYLIGKANNAVLEKERK